MRKYLNWFLLLGGLIPLGFCVGAHIAVRWYIAHHYPWTSVGSVSFEPWYLRLENVQVHQVNLNGTLREVRVTWDRTIRIDGGALELNVGESEPNTVEKKHRIFAKNLDVTVRRKDLTAWLTNVTKSPDQPTCTLHAKVEHLKCSGTLNNVCLFGTDVNFDSAELNVPGYCPNLKITNGYGSKSEGCYKAKLASCGVYAAEGAEVEISPSGAISVAAQSILVAHRVLSSEALVFDRPVMARWENGILTTKVDSLDLRADPEELSLEGSGLCQDWVDNLPRELRKPLEDFKFDGKLAFQIGIKKPKVRIKGGCKVSCKNPKLVALGKQFHYEVYGVDGATHDRISGPGSKDWVYMTEISSFMPIAVTTLEDPGFPVHRGWIAQAFENSLIDNLKHGKFLRGGSTITMQLAKNLWLRREKTLGRKIQEFFLASALESCLGKDRILELYFNVVEFGPNIYGIGPAAKYHFDTSPAALDMRQAFWLAHILPKPRQGKPTEADLARIEPLIERLRPELGTDKEPDAEWEAE